jgi:hypothetical protein
LINRFNRVWAPSPEIKPLQLESNVPGNADYGPSPDQGGWPAQSPISTPPPALRNLLPSSSSVPGDAQPMIAIKAPAPYPALAEDFARTRILPNSLIPKPEPSFGIKGLLESPKEPLTKIKGGKKK